jgi:hypothetical protein
MRLVKARQNGYGDISETEESEGNILSLQIQVSV